MNGRSWSDGELERAVTYRRLDLSWAAIATLLGRGPYAVRGAVQRQRRRDRPPVIDLAAEIACARAERATAPLLRTWPEGLWT